MSEIGEEEIARVVRQAMLSNPNGGPFRHRESERSLIASEAARQILALLQPALERARREAEQAKALVGLLQDDLAKLSEAHDRCEGCGAPIAFDEDACTAADVSGCWGYAADVKGAPCWRYRTKDGMDRAWPDCAAIRKGPGE